MNPPDQTEFPDTTTQESDTTGQPSIPTMLEGMKVLFDDKVGLYPVDLVAKDEKNTDGRKHTS